MDNSDTSHNVAYWTGIGSRETPEDILRLMTILGKTLTDFGWVLRSGGAQGADTAFYEGCKLSENFERAKSMVYISWNGMKSGDTKLWHNPALGLYDATRYPTWEEANQIALKTRGSFERLGKGGIAHHTRNVFQIQGHHLDTLSKFVICWAIPVGKTGAVKGGTATAVKLARQCKVEVINLYTDEGYNRAVDFLDKHNVVHDFVKRTA